MISTWGGLHGKSLYTECIAVGDPDEETNPTPNTDRHASEVFTSEFTNAKFQTAQYCKKVQNHPVFSKSDFNIIGISQGGLLARDLI